MTIEDKLKALLVRRGVSPQDAITVLGKLKTDPDNEPMAGRWTDDVEGYPSQLLAALWYSTQKVAGLLGE